MSFKYTILNTTKQNIHYKTDHASYGTNHKWRFKRR